MIFFWILGGLFIVIGIWSFFSLRKNKRKWADFLVENGFEFDPQNQLIRQEAILLNLSEKQQVLWARGTNHLNESRPDSGIEILPYDELKSFKAEINHQLVSDYSTVGQLLVKATIVKMEINGNQVEKLMINPNDLADKNVRAALQWWLVFMHELAQKNQARNHE